MGSTDTQLRQTVAENDPVATNSYLYSYDSLNRLARAGITSGTGTTYIYGYDATGNMTSKTVGGTPTSFRYNAANELCWAVSGLTSNTCAAAPVGATTYSYDANGNEIGSSSGAAFTYNTKNQTTAITHGGVALSPLTYSGADQTLRITAGSTTFNNGPPGLQVSTVGGMSTYYLRDAQGRLIGERIGSNRYYYLTDALGSITAVVSDDGLTIGDRYGYDPYGSFTYQSGTIANPWGYAGTYFDAATGLYKIGKRYYDPSLGRWTQEDAVRDTGTDPQAGTLYAYAKDDPINVVDPNGNWGIPIPRYRSTFRRPPSRHNPFRSWSTTAWFFSGLVATGFGVGFTVLLVGEIAATGGLSLIGPSIFTGGAAATSYAWAGYSFRRALQ
jgi:RHS repeat-associated protein